MTEVQNVHFFVFRVYVALKLIVCEKKNYVAITLTSRYFSRYFYWTMLAALISVAGKYAARCSNNAIIAESQMKTIFI